MNRDISKPMILPHDIVEMLRGERGFTEGSKEHAQLGRDFYQAGKAGRAYESPVITEDLPLQGQEVVTRFLLACWNQGGRDVAGCEA